MSDETVHYMESTSRLRAENEELRGELGICNRQRRDNLERAGAAEATMREVAEELRRLDIDYVANSTFTDLADRLDPPPVDATRSIHGGVHCAPPGGPNNTCYRLPDGSCESCGYPPYAVENP